jgi:hypothetical protein
MTRSKCIGSGSTGCWGPNGIILRFPILFTVFLCKRCFHSRSVELAAEVDGLVQHAYTEQRFYLVFIQVRATGSPSV